jgi:hypothetical protein
MQHKRLQMTEKVQQLTLPKLELALRVVHRAWEKAKGPEARVKPPKSLQHLEQEDWQAVCSLLSLLERQVERSQIH